MDLSGFTASILFGEPPAVVAPAPWLRHFYGLGPWFFRLLLKIAERRIATWNTPIVKLRERLGSPQTRFNPITRGQFSPYGTLALFSRCLGGRRKTGQCEPGKPAFYFMTGSAMECLGIRERSGRNYRRGLGRFSNRVRRRSCLLWDRRLWCRRIFFAESLRAVEMLGERAILLVGREEKASLPEQLPESVFVADYVPYSEVMPKVAAIVHQGGIGTTAQSLSAGKPELVVPWAHDQPDNAERVRKLGVGRWIGRDKYAGSLAARELRKLLDEPGYARQAEAVAREIRQEDGERAGCDAIEMFLRASKSVRAAETL